VANSFQVVRQYPDTEYLGGTQTRPVTAVGYRTIPYNIYFESRIPDASYNQTEVDNTGKVNSEPLIAVRALTNVTDVEWTQVTRPSGYVEDEIIVYYRTPTGNSEGSLITPFTGISAAVVQPLVDEAVSDLTASENL